MSSFRLSFVKWGWEARHKPTGQYRAVKVMSKDSLVCRCNWGLRSVSSNRNSASSGQSSKSISNVYKNIST